MPITDTPRIFISYSRGDGEAFATDLRAQLIEVFGEEALWQDRAKMEGGVGWWKQIEEALGHVEYMVLIATPQAIPNRPKRAVYPPIAPIRHAGWRGSA